MDPLKDRILATKDEVEKQYEDIKDKALGDKASEKTSRSLERIEESLGVLKDKIEEGRLDISTTMKVRSDRFMEDLEELRETIEEQKEDIKENGLKDKSENVIENVKNRYNEIVERYLKVR
ncbi:MAG: hypothetical protein R6V01_03300 [Thermoplasmatota archaeon]